MVLPTFVPVTGSQECCSHLISLRTTDGTINFVVSGDTFVVDAVRLRSGMRVTAFYNPNVPVPLIFPPQYRAEVIAPLLPGDQAAMGLFDDDLLAANGSLQLTLDNRTILATPNGQRYECSPGGNTLLVYYRNTTRSIPPQTTPRKIIVFC